ncbi:hypothetical protein [Actinomyces faecalis]|uniref:hypothetical protein n=1 Tax=Actinomyces faecalis TaxID=2722820 RepID=UPI001553EAA7|nr:hypothetical protein [Actinomyces faecalis]
MSVCARPPLRVTAAQAPAVLAGLVARYEDVAYRGTRSAARVVLAIDGMTGSGKSTLAASLVRVLLGQGRRVTVLAVEDLVPGWDGLAEGVARAAQALRDLARAGTACPVTWDWERMEPAAGRPLTLPGGGVLVVEGCGALAAAAQDLPGTEVVRVLVKAPAPLRHRRVADRDPYAWDVTAWEAQELQVARTWRAEPGWGPDVVVRPQEDGAAEGVT